MERFVVPGELRQDIRESVWSAGIVGRIKLRTKLSVEQEREHHFANSYILLRVLYFEAPGKIVIRVPHGAEQRSACVRNANMDVCVFADGQEQIRRIGRESFAVRRFQSP